MDVPITVLGEAGLERCFYVPLTLPEPLCVASEVTIAGISLTLKMKSDSSYTIDLSGLLRQYAFY